MPTRRRYGTRFCLPYSFDHLVGTGGERRRNVEGERFGGLGVYHQLEFGWRLHRQVSRLLAFENASDIGGGTPKEIGSVNPKRHEAAIGGVKAEGINRRKTVTGGKPNDQIAMDRG